MTQNESPYSTERPHWSLDRRVPIALIVVLVIQLVGGGITIGVMMNQQNTNTHNIVKLQDNAERIVRLEASMDNLATAIKDLKEAIRDVKNSGKSRNN